MLLAAVRDNTYNLMLVIHIAAVAVTFAPVILGPFQQSQLEATGGDEAIKQGAKAQKFFTSTVSMGAFVVVLLTGIGMIISSDDAISMGDTWVSVSFVLWIVIAGVISGVVGKGERLKSQGDLKGMGLVQWGSTAAVMLGVVVIWIMIDKPWL